VLYEKGIGVKKELKLARKYYEISAKLGYRKAINRLNEMGQNEIQPSS